jgi:hypothetical protein
MASTIKIKRSTTAASIPSGLSAGELAINLPDKRLYSSNGTVTFRVGDKELANTNARINLVNTNLTGTNTALRTLISDRLQVANAATIYQTKTVERAALANTNASIATQASRITLVNTNLTGTNTAIRALDAQKLSVANATILFATKASWTALTGTNTALRLLISDRLQVANATTIFNTKATWTALTGTNTALRTLISDRLQVANAAVIYQTKTIERAALANTNASIATQASRITLVNTNLLATNTAIRALDAAKLSVANAATLYATKVNPTTSGILAHTGRATISTNLGVTGNTSVGGDLVVTGNFTVNGTTTTLNSTTLSVDDINITLGDTVSPSNATADGGGITLKGTTDKTFNWVSATASWTSSENINLASTKTLFLNGSDFRATFAANSYVKSVLANTNSFIKSQLANTNASIATQTSRITLVNTNLTGTNTALRTLINDRLQVANAAVIYQTKTVERAALANTNASIATQASRITLVNTNLTGTNTAIRALDAAKLSVANAVAIYVTKVNPTTSGLLAHTGRATISTNLYVAGNTILGNPAVVTDRTVINGVTVANGQLTVTGNSAITGTLTVTGAATFNGAITLGDAATDLLTVNGRATIAQNLSVSGNTTLGAAGKTISTTGLLAHTGRQTISTNLAVTGNTTLGGTLVANNTAGTSGYYLRTSGTGIFWSPIVAQNQYLQVSNANATFATKVNPTTSGLLAHTGRMTISTNLAVSGNTRITGSTIIDGDLTVEGAVTYISSSTLNVDDSMIKLAANNAADTVDVGFYGKYVATGTKYSGIFRDASDGVFKVYTGLTVEPTSTVDIVGAGYTAGTLDAIIDGGTY